MRPGSRLAAAYGGTVNTLKKALVTYGIDAQLLKLAEECAGCCQAALEYQGEKSKDHEESLSERIAGVEILVDQMRLYFGDVRIDANRCAKLRRLDGRMAAAEKLAAVRKEGRMLVSGSQIGRSGK
jgi:hypothetical protein